jgi:hypothetical protein
LEPAAAVTKCAPQSRSGRSILASPGFAFANEPWHCRDKSAAELANRARRSLAVQCHQCRHEVIMNVDHLPGDLTVSSSGPRMVCAKCGMRLGPTQVAFAHCTPPKDDHVLT